MIIFNDIRLWGKDLPIDKKLYPLQTFIPKFKRHRCDACNVYFAK